MTELRQLHHDLNRIINGGLNTLTYIKYINSLTLIIGLSNEDRSVVELVDIRLQVTRMEYIHSLVNFYNFTKAINPSNVSNFKIKVTKPKDDFMLAIYRKDDNVGVGCLGTYIKHGKVRTNNFVTV